MAGSVDPTLDRLFRQEIWVLRKVFAYLRSLPEDVLAMRASSTDWDVATTLTHIVDAAGAYAARVDGQRDPDDLERPRTHEDLARLEAVAITAAERLRAQVAEGSDTEVLEVGRERTWRYPRSLTLAQSVYHSIEHRAQLFGILAANGVTGLTLDDLDHWSYGEAEGDLSSS